jgi:hypothetical protein
MMLDSDMGDTSTSGGSSVYGQGAIVRNGTLDEFPEVSLLGEGGGGRVFLSEHKSYGLVAVKSIQHSHVCHLFLRGY